jgi:hypothetical protein
MGLNPAGAQAGVPEAVDPDAWLKDGRFVGPTGKPLLAKDLQDPPVKEYRLMAFRMNLTVDELRWDRLLLELANSPLPLEVREVRINVASDSNGDAGHGGQRRPQQPESDKGPVRNISLELRGVAYLINPPNAQSLGLTDEAPAAPTTGTLTAPATGAPTAPATGAPATPATGAPTAPDAGTPTTPATGAPAAPATGGPAAPAPGPAAPATVPAAPPSGAPPATPATGAPATGSTPPAATPPTGVPGTVPAPAK